MSAVEPRERALLLFARAPLAGQVKTRLQPDLTPAEALSLHRALIVDAANLLRGAAERLGCYVGVRFTEPLEPGDELRQHLGHLELGVQEGDDLGERLLHAVQERLHHGAGAVVVIGSDSPAMTIDYVEHAFQVLETQEMVVGPARDGGYVLIGCSKLRVRPFQNIPWGTDQVLDRTLKTLRKLKIPHELLRPGRDLDTFEDLVHAYQELRHLEAVGAAHAARTLTTLRIIITAHPEWEIH